MEYFCSNCLWLHQSLSEKKSGDDRLESESHQHRIVPKTRSKTITRTTTTSQKYNMGKSFFFSSFLYYGLWKNVLALTIYNEIIFSESKILVKTNQSLSWT